MGDRYGFAEPTRDPEKDKKQSIIEEVMIEFPNASIEEQMQIVNERVSDSTSVLDKMGGLGSVLKFGGNLALDVPSSIVDTAVSVPVNTVGRFFGYNPGMSANKGVEFIKKGIFGENAEIYDENDPNRDEDANPNVAEFFGINTDATNTSTKKAEETRAIIEQQNKDNARKLANQQKEEKTNKIINNMYDEKPDSDVIKEYMDMFSEAYGTDKEALNRSRYLELAKFGANILAQPGGQSIGEVLGQAGGPALEGMTKIEEAENQGQRQLKGVAMQAALKKMDNPYLDQLKLKSQITGKSMAEIINAETTPAGQGRVDELKLQQLAVDLSSVLTSKDVDFDSKAMAEILTKNKLKTSDVLKHTNPKDPGAELIVDQIYIFTKPTNGQYVGTWNGTGFDIID